MSSEKSFKFQTLQRDATTNQYPSTVEDGSYQYRHFVDVDGTDNCYYIRNDGLVCRYYPNHGYDSKMYIVPTISDEYGYYLVNINGRYYMIAELLIMTFCPHLSQAKYKSNTLA